MNKEVPEQLNKIEERGKMERTEAEFKKPFEEMKNDILSGQYKEMKDIYGSDGPREIFERAIKNPNIVVREIIMGWDKENKKMRENEIVAVKEILFDLQREGEDKRVGYIMKDEDENKLLESRDEFFKAVNYWNEVVGSRKETTLRDGKGNLLRKVIEISHDSGERQGFKEEKTTYYKNNKEIVNLDIDNLLRDSLTETLRPSHGQRNINYRIRSLNSPIKILEHFSIWGFKGLSLWENKDIERKKEYRGANLVREYEEKIRKIWDKDYKAE